MENEATQPNKSSTVGDRAGTIGVYIILGIFGYMLLFGILFLGLAASGKSGWYLFYIPLCAIPGIMLGPLILALQKHNNV